MGFLIYPVFFMMTACASELPALLAPESPAETGNVIPVPELIAYPFQETVYTGGPQSIRARSEPALPLIIWYYTSEEDYWLDRNGVSDPPSEPGFYFVNVNCAPGYGYARTEDKLVRYRIRRAPFEIFAAAVQETPFNGNPRRVEATAEPGLPLSFSYYPNPELRHAAIENFFRAGGGSASFSTALSRFTRVESAPVEQGVYYVLVYFPGNDRYEAAFKAVDFTIGPPVPRNRG